MGGSTGEYSGQYWLRMTVADVTTQTETMPLSVVLQAQKVTSKSSSTRQQSIREGRHTQRNCRENILPAGNQSILPCRDVV